MYNVVGVVGGVEFIGFLVNVVGDDRGEEWEEVREYALLLLVALHASAKPQFSVFNRQLFPNFSFGTPVQRPQGPRFVQRPQPTRFAAQPSFTSSFIR